MKKWIYFLIILCSGLLQITLLNSIKFFGVKPDLLLISAVIAAMFFDLKWALIYGVSSGILKDIFCSQIFGINTILFPLWIILLVRLRKDVTFDNNYLRFGIMCCVGLAQNIVTGLILVYLGNYIPLGVFVRIVVIESIYTALCLLPALKFIQPAFSKI